LPVIKLTPHGCVDSVYSPGAGSPTGMAALGNLVPAIDTADQWVPRPAAVAFSSSSVQFITAQIVVGTRLYGMRQSTSFVGYDVPFCFDLLANSYIAITGVTAGNVPANAPSTGSWQPPHMEVIGIKIILSHTGFSGAGTNFFGVIDMTNPAAPAWNSANTATNALPSVPVWVSQFNQRAFYYCNPTGVAPAVLASDVLIPDSRSATVAPFILTFGDNVPLLCGGSLGLNNQLGGIIQGLMIFKIQPTNIWQITGDFVAGGGTGGQSGVTGQQLLTMNTLNVATGTYAPNSVTPTPKGLAFLAPDGWRIIDYNAHVSNPIGEAGSGIVVPFTSAVQPSRVAAACNATTLRASTQNGAVAGAPQQEWCFDLVRDCWFGPHTFPVSLISEYGNSFIITTTPAITGQIWQSDIMPNATSVYTENALPYTCTYQSSLFPDRDNIMELSTIKAVLYQGYGAGNIVYSISALNQNASILPGGFAQLSFSTAGVVWGTFVWGSGQSLGGVAQIAGYDVPWSSPLTFDRMSVLVTVVAAAGIRLGAFMMDVQEEGYTVTP
jgi:hypothetical protein